MKIIDFWAEWCGPCKMMNPVLEELKNEYPDIIIEKINVDEDPESAKEYGISSIPTFVVFDDSGNQVKTILGAMPKPRFKKELGLA
jgi:thioredoxin 1